MFNDLETYNKRRSSLTPQRKIRNKLQNKYNWEIIIPFVFVILMIAIQLGLHLLEINGRI